MKTRAGDRRIVRRAAGGKPARRGFSYSGPVQGFEPLPAQVDLPALEHEILTRWQDAGIFERSLKQTAGGPAWIFYEGPPTANGLPGKRDIEAYGVAEFNARCRESVLRHVDAWLEMSRRMGYWADTDHAYRTMDPSYIESVWW